MPPNLPDFHSVVKALSDENARYVLVGGLAMVAYGVSTVTYDMDLAVSTEAENVQALVRALSPFHPYPPQYGSPTHFVWDGRSFVGAVLSLTSDVGDLDILLVQPGVESFQDLWDRSMAINLAGQEVRVASLDDLIAMKEAAGREKNEIHLRQLRALRDLREHE